MKGNDQVLDFSKEGDHKKALGKLENAELIFCLDFSVLNRVNELGELIRQSKAFVVNIDHHQDPEDFAQFRLWSTAAAATCELVYELIVELGDKNLIDKHIAACLYAGIMTDTGGFRHPNTTKNVHLVVAELLEAGADATAIANLIYDSNSLNRLKFIGFAITKRLVVREDLQLAYFVISKKDLKKYQSQTGDTEGLVNYALSLDGVKLAALFSEREDGVKISFRSSVDVAVNKFAAAHFGGGGHKNAAGGKSSLSLKKTVTRFESLVQEYQEDLFHSKEVPTL
jgi:phosphoesterase RecJ-like protein